MSLVDAHGPLADRILARSLSVRVPRAAARGRCGRSQRRRVLMTADAVGGVWPYALDLSYALRSRGIDISLAVMGPSPSAAQHGVAAALGIEVDASPFKLEWMDAAWPDVDRAGEWLLDLERLRQPDVVHINGFAHASLPWRAPTVVVAHSCVCSWWRGVHGVEAPEAWAEYRARVAAGLAAARAVVAPTAAMLSALAVEYGWAFQDARVIPNGRAYADRPREMKQPFVLAAGRVWDDAKNIRALCAIAPVIAWPVYIAGDVRDPAGRGDVEIAASTPVRFLGRLDPSALGQWFDRAAIYALPARYEPFGLSILEAASAGCALVLGDITSLRENWSGAALFVPPDDRAALAAAIRRLIDHDDERCALATRAHERARRFGIDKTADAYARVYCEASHESRLRSSNWRRPAAAEDSA